MAGFTDSEESCASRSRPWYEAAAARGDADGLYNVGSLLDDAGTDPVRARALLTEAAEMGSFTAQYALGAMLIDGRGCEGGAPDVQGAERWFGAGAAQGCYRSQCGMARVRASRNELNEAFGWMLQAAEQRANLGLSYLHGTAGAPQDEAAAERWIREAAEAGHPRAQLTMGRLALWRAKSEAVRGARESHDEVGSRAASAGGVSEAEAEAWALDRQAMREAREAEAREAWEAEAALWLQLAAAQGQHEATWPLVRLRVRQRDLLGACRAVAAWWRWSEDGEVIQSFLFKVKAALALGASAGFALIASAS
jgi:hypothetical protein